MSKTLEELAEFLFKQEHPDDDWDLLHGHQDPTIEGRMVWRARASRIRQFLDIDNPVQVMDLSEAEQKFWKTVYVEALTSPELFQISYELDPKGDSRDVATWWADRAINALRSRMK